MQSRLHIPALRSVPCTLPTNAKSPAIADLPTSLPLQATRVWPHLWRRSWCRGFEACRSMDPAGQKSTSITTTRRHRYCVLVVADELLALVTRRMMRFVQGAPIGHWSHAFRCRSIIRCSGYETCGRLPVCPRGPSCLPPVLFWHERSVRANPPRGLEPESVRIRDSS